ncbi:MAG: DUF885 family protein [Croceibacterium sp.]
MYRREFLGGASAAALALTLDAQVAHAQTSGDAKLRDVMDQILADDLQRNPETATSLGVDKAALAPLHYRLGKYGKAGDLAGFVAARAMRAKVAAIAPGSLSERWQVRRAVVLDMLDQRLVSEPFRISSVGAPYRLSQQDGAYFSIPDFLDSTHPVQTLEDAQGYIDRLAAFPGALDEQSDAQREEAARGFLAPAWSLDLVKKQIGALLDGPAAQTGMVMSLARRAAEKGIAGDWAASATNIVENQVRPALRRQLALVGELQPTTRAGDGVWRLDRGEEIYARALRYFTTTNLSADEIHRTGLRQVAEIGAELDTILTAASLTQGTVGARLAALNTRPDQLFANDDNGRAALIASLNASVRAMQAKLPQAFSAVTVQPLEIRRVPPDIQDGAPNGYYSSASLDGSRPAIYWINLKSTADWPKYSLPALTYHEGVPGHHLHFSYLQQEKDLPVLLQNYFISAYGEGWALYAEQVGNELGGYQGIEKAGALQSWLFRAARLVVDTGIHAKRWSREKATDYFVDTVGFTRARSQREIERYCVSPGQACSYKIGQNEWRRLRTRAQTALGPKFDLRQFHDLLKEGVMPLDLLDKRVAAWTAKVKAGRA